ncbi:dihydrofolate reductase family protein [Microbacterium sp. AZCO]|uniref:dihydrofolate reductase family protein n=1 Tax=Microbacterium sp. AZCO TaxID=3142976 RepID=UPI0031F39CF5
MMIPDTAPQTAEGKVICHFTMSLDGFIAGPGHSMEWLDGFTTRPGLIEEYIATTGAVLGGRRGLDAFPDAATLYGGAWSGPVFVLTHHPDDAPPSRGITLLDCDLAEAIEIARDAAGGKNVEILSASIGRQLLERGLLDEFDLHIAPVLLGDGVRLYAKSGAEPVRLDFVMGDGPRRAVNIRATPTTA